MVLWMLIYLTLAAVYDWRDFQIPNWLNAAGGVITITLCIWQGLDWSVMAAGILIPFFCCIGLFYLGALGGGDIKVLMVCGIPMGVSVIHLLILSFLWNGVTAVCILWKHRSFRLRFSYLRHYLSGCLREGRIASYENPDDESKYLHFTYGIFLAYLTLIAGGFL